MPFFGIQQGLFRVTGAQVNFSGDVMLTLPSVRNDIVARHLAVINARLGDVQLRCIGTLYLDRHILYPQIRQPGPFQKFVDRCDANSVTVCKRQFQFGPLFGIRTRFSRCDEDLSVLFRKLARDRPSRYGTRNFASRASATNPIPIHIGIRMEVVMHLNLIIA